MDSSPFDSLQSLDKKWWHQQKKPFFIYDETILINHFSKVKTLQNTLFPAPSGTPSGGSLTPTPLLSGSIYYSVKANPNPFLLESLSQRGAHFDISSLLELKALEGLKTPPERVSFSGPAKSDETLQFLFDSYPCTIHLDNIEEWHYLQPLFMSPPRPSESRRGYPKLSLRLNSPNPITHKLGFPKKDLELLLIEAQKNKMTLEGFHTYLGRENFSSKEMMAFFNESTHWINQYSTCFPHPQLFLGLGLPAVELLNGPIQSEISDFQIQKQTLNLPRALTVHIELGRGLVTGCGVYGTEILSVKRRGEESLVIVNGGFQHTSTKLSSVRFGTQGFQIRAYRDGEPIKAGTTDIFQIYGSLGIGHDKLIQCPLPADLKRGDFLLIEPVGAYGITASTNQFLGMDQAQEYFLSAAGQLFCHSPIPTYLEELPR